MIIRYENTDINMSNVISILYSDDTILFRSADIDIEITLDDNHPREVVKECLTKAFMAGQRFIDLFNAVRTELKENEPDEIFTISNNNGDSFDFYTDMYISKTNNKIVIGQKQRPVCDLVFKTHEDTNNAYSVICSILNHCDGEANFDCEIVKL